MYLTAVDLRWEETVPAQTPTRRKLGEERLCHDLPAALRVARTLPAQEHARPGPGGIFGLLLGTPTNPALAPSLYRASHGHEDRRQVQGRGRWLRSGVWGASGHGCASGSPSTCCMGSLPPGALPEGLRSPGSLYLPSPASEMPTRPPPGVLVKRRGRWWKRSSP